MPDSIPQWVTDIENDETIFKKNNILWTTGIVILIIVYFIIGFLLMNYNRNYFWPFGISWGMIFIIFFFYRLKIEKPDIPNLLATNLYRIGIELEAFNPSSPSYIERNKQYLKNSQKIINKFVIEDDYGFIENYNNFFNNFGELFLRLNGLYSRNSKSENIVNISEDLKRLAESIHENHKNIEPVHIAYVEGILSNLQNIEPLAPPINRLYNSIITGWYNISYSYRVIFTMLVIGIIIFAATSIVMIHGFGMRETDSYGYAIVGTMTLMAALITKTDKIVPKEKIKFSK